MRSHSWLPCTLFVALNVVFLICTSWGNSLNQYWKLIIYDTWHPQILQRVFQTGVSSLWFTYLFSPPTPQSGWYYPLWVILPTLEMANPPIFIRYMFCPSLSQNWNLLHVLRCWNWDWWPLRVWPLLPLPSTKMDTASEPNKLWTRFKVYFINLVQIIIAFFYMTIAFLIVSISGPSCHFGEFIS